MEKNLTIPILGTHKRIYAIQRGNLKKPVVIFVHGLSCTMNEHYLFNGARYLEREGFTSFRFNLYDWRDDARKLHECDFTTYAHDLEEVVSFLRKKGARKIFAVGHSYGGVTVLLAKPELFHAVSLWDASNYAALPKDFEKKFTRVEKGLHVLRGNSDFVMSPSLLQQLNTINWKSLTKQYTTPTQVVVAGKGMLMKGGKQYFEYSGASKKEFVVIKGATHCFDEGDTEVKLFEATSKWFKKFV